MLKKSKIRMYEAANAILTQNGYTITGQEKPYKDRSILNTISACDIDILYPEQDIMYDNSSIMQMSKILKAIELNSRILSKLQHQKIHFCGTMAIFYLKDNISIDEGLDGSAEIIADCCTFIDADYRAIRTGSHRNAWVRPSVLKQSPVVIISHPKWSINTVEKFYHVIKILAIKNELTCITRNF